MWSKGYFTHKFNLFCKEIGNPTSLVVNPPGGKTSKQVKKFCSQIGTSLRLLEDSTQWENWNELYIGIFKEAIYKDIRSTNFSMSIWEYCAKGCARIKIVPPKICYNLMETYQVSWLLESHMTSTLLVNYSCTIGATSAKKRNSKYHSKKNNLFVYLE